MFKSAPLEGFIRKRRRMSKGRGYTKGHGPTPEMIRAECLRQQGLDACQASRLMAIPARTINHWYAGDCKQYNRQFDK